MDRAGFWKQIGKVDVDSLRDGDEEAAVGPLIESLSDLGENQIYEFEEHLSQVLYALDGRKWFDAAGDNDSDDRFLYARCYAVAMGESYYTGVLNNPATFPRTAEQRFESLLFASSEAWADSTGNDEDDWEFDATVSYETGSNKAQW